MASLLPSPNLLCRELICKHNVNLLLSRSPSIFLPWWAIAFLTYSTIGIFLASTNMFQPIADIGPMLIFDGIVEWRCGGASYRVYIWTLLRSILFVSLHMQPGHSYLRSALEALVPQLCNTRHNLASTLLPFRHMDTLFDKHLPSTIWKYSPPQLTVVTPLVILPIILRSPSRNDCLFSAVR